MIFGPVFGARFLSRRAATKAPGNFLMSYRPKHLSGLSSSDQERAAAAIRILDAHVQFGVSLLRGEQPQRPSLEEEKRQKPKR